MPEDKPDDQPDLTQPAATEPEQTAVSSDSVPRRGLAVKVVAVVVVLALVAGAGFLAFAIFTGQPNRTIALGDTVAGMARNTEVDGDSDSDFVAIKERMRGLIPGVADVEVGAYTNADEDRGPAGPLFVIGAEIDGDIEPGQLIGQIRSNAEKNSLATEEVDAGEDAEGICVTDASGETAGQCVWATTTSFGQIINVTPGWDAESLGALMVDVRADVETTE